MAQKILIKKSTVAAKAPTDAQLDVGELAVNTADALLYTKHSDGSIKRLSPTLAERTKIADSVSSSDARLTNSREWSEATVTQAEAEGGIASTRRAWTSQRVRQAINAWWQLVTSGFGRNLVSASNEAAARNVLQLGTAATANVGTAVGQIKPVGDASLYCLDIDDETQRGEWYVNNNTTGVKPATYGIVNTYGSTRDSVNQEYVELVGGGDTAVKRRFCRNKYSTNAWSPWTEYITSSSLQTTTGQSTEYPMSQKAATEALNTKANTASLGTAATANLTTSTTDGTVGRVLKVGDGGWMGQGQVSYTPIGYPPSLEDATNQTKAIRSTVSDNGVAASATGIHFSAADTWGRLRVNYDTPSAWIQGGFSTDGTGWTSQVVLSANLLQTTGTSTVFPMSQKATTDALATKAALRAASNIDGGVRMRLSGTTLYITNNGSNA